MAHRRQADAYDYLATSKVSELTVAQLEQALENSFLNKSNIEFWKGPIVMHKLLEVGRTYPGAGMPIPEESTVALSGLIVAGGDTNFKPEGSGIWAIMGIEVEATGGTPAVVISLEESSGGATCLIHSGAASTTPSSFFPWESPLMVTNSLALHVSNGDAVEGIQAKVAYHVVSL